MYSKFTEMHGILMLWGPRLGVEMNMKSDHFIYAPKVGWEFSMTPLIVRGNLIANIDKGKVDLRILPEVGLSFFGLINLTYGYSISTLEFKTTEISRHRFGITTNLDFDVWRRL